MKKKFAGIIQVDILDIWTPWYLNFSEFRGTWLSQSIELDSWSQGYKFDYLEIKSSYTNIYTYMYM